MFCDQRHFLLMWNYDGNYEVPEYGKIWREANQQKCSSFSLTDKSVGILKDKGRIMRGLLPWRSR